MIKITAFVFKMHGIEDTNLSLPTLPYILKGNTHFVCIILLNLHGVHIYCTLLLYHVYKKLKDETTPRTEEDCKALCGRLYSTSEKNNAVPCSSIPNTPMDMSEMAMPPLASRQSLEKNNRIKQYFSSLC